MSNSNVALIEQFNLFFQIYESLLPYIFLNDTQKKYFDSKKIWTTKLREEKFAVAFFGSFTSGKSTLINAILHQELLPEGVKSTTAFPTLIKKGERDIATIYYLNSSSKNKYKGQLIYEIREAIGNKMPPYNQNTQQFLQDINHAIVQYEQESQNKVERKPYEQLKQLLENWSEQNTPSTEVNLTNLKSYVEGHPDSLFIDRIEVTVKDINLANDIVIVDLPGVAVSNLRHLNFTEDYLTKKAKAFVVCMKPRSLIEGEEAKFLKRIHAINPSILSNSFWIINQWDSLNAVEKRGEEENFQQKIIDYQFNIDPDRFFKISALQYSLLRYIAEGTLEQTKKRKKEIDTLQSIKSPATDISSPEAQSFLKIVEPVVDFAKFKEALFAHLNTDAKNEFFASVTNELFEMIQKLTQMIEPDYSQYQNQKMDDFRSIKLESETRKELDRFICDLEQKIRDFAKDIRTYYSQTDYWTDSIQNEINREIDTVLINTPELKNELRKGAHQDSDYSQLSAILKKKIGLVAILEKYLTVDTFLEQINNLSRELRLVNQRYLPQSTFNVLEDKLGKRDIQMRISGVADIIFFDLGDKFQDIGFELKNLLKETEQSFDDSEQDNNDNELIESALDQYRQELTKFMSSLKPDINKYINRSIKNHVEYLDEELPKLLNANPNKDAITLKIRENLEKSKTVENEIQKKEVITAAYQKLIALQQSL